ncbi:MAG: bifunctional riboflavin kinase/FAD synthetase [Cytophagales bacterium]|nr:bifunctional riboflavin kinase/FAD synthetase [Cytophagales bacterium]
MKILTSRDFPLSAKSAVTIGFFDGFHLAHQLIIKNLTEYASHHQIKSVVITFWPHPKSVLAPENYFQYLLSIDEKTKLFEESGIDYLYIIPFTNEISEISATDFLKNILLSQLCAKHIILGYDHHFGKNREGNYKFLLNKTTDYQYTVQEIKPQIAAGEIIHSSTVKEALRNGETGKANAMLGYEYFISGTVIEGKKLGRKLGFATANIKINFNQKLLPKPGVYAVYCTVRHTEYKAMLNMGTRPTVNGQNMSVEVHIFDFNETIYGEDITIKFKKRLRNEKKFNSLDELKNQLFEDKNNSLSVL